MSENTSNHSNDTEKHGNGAGYALSQLAKALHTGAHHPDPETQQRAHKRVENWAIVFERIVTGSLAVGSRVPLTGVPEWVTLKVLTGGFATGEFLAGGPLEAHERLLLEKLQPAPEENARLALNTYFLTEAGLLELQALLESGAYTVNVPEEGALLVVAWLIKNDQLESARQLLETLGPWFSNLRFYPIPNGPARHSGSRVFIQTVDETLASLKRIQPNINILSQKEMVGIWTPMYDQIVQLFLETIEGELPSLQCDANGKWVRTETGKFPVQGGWPCQHYPAGWFERASTLLEAYQTERAVHQRCQRPEDDRDNFARLRGYLARCVQDHLALNGRDIGHIRQILACYLTKRGNPNSPQCQSMREQQLKHANAPTHHEIVKAILPRLQALPLQDGLDDPALVVYPITADEATQFYLPNGTDIPESLQRKVERSLIATVDILIERGLITSADTMAQILPQMTSGIRAAGFVDPILRQLFAAIYAAFRRRRSLLLLNLEHQIQLEEIPWIATIDRFRQKELPVRELARQTLEEVSILTLTAFPQAILPNKLVQELVALAKTAEFTIPLVDEIAADIFMGKFSSKFLEAARQAGDLLSNTLYSTYYGIDYQQIRTIQTEAPKKKRKLIFFQPMPPKDTFAELCAQRAGVKPGGNPAVNGMVIEQQQILTTQNLAVLFKKFHLAHTLGEQLLNEFAQACFQWVCQRLQIKADRWHAHLIQVKNSAYAWRQMIFFLALLSKPAQASFLRWAEGHLGQQPTLFQQRFRPALLGLSFAIRGKSLESQVALQAGARRFTGWSKEKHWLLADEGEHQR